MMTNAQQRLTEIAKIVEQDSHDLLRRGSAAMVAGLYWLECQELIEEIIPKLIYEAISKCVNEAGRIASYSEDPDDIVDSLEAMLRAELEGK